MQSLQELKRESHKKKRKRFYKVDLLEKAKIETIKIQLSRDLIDSYINHDEFISVNYMLKEYNEKKEEIKNPENVAEYTI